MGAPAKLQMKKGDVLCTAGNSDLDLYIIHSGRFLVCVTKGTQVTPLSVLEAGEYVGELSFFDHHPRSAHVICLEPGVVLRIPHEEMQKQFPPWLRLLGQSVAKKLRHTDELIRTKGIRRKNAQTIQPLTIEEQRHYYSILKDRIQS